LSQENDESVGNRRSGAKAKGSKVKCVASVGGVQTKKKRRHDINNADEEFSQIRYE